jgi:hypothetical protein
VEQLDPDSPAGVGVVSVAADIVIGGSISSSNKIDEVDGL